MTALRWDRRGVLAQLGGEPLDLAADAVAGGEVPPAGVAVGPCSVSWIEAGERREISGPGALSGNRLTVDAHPAGFAVELQPGEAARVRRLAAERRAR